VRLSEEKKRDMDKKSFELHSHPRPFYPYLILGMSILFIFYKMMLLAFPEVIRVIIMKDLSISLNQVENLSTVGIYTTILFPIPLGLLIDRFNTTKFVSLSILIASLGAFIFATSNTYGIAVVGRLLIGCGNAMALINAAKMISNWFLPTRFAQLLGIALGIGFLGGTVGQHYFVYSAEVIGWRMSLIHLSIAGFIYCLLYLLIVKDQGIQYNLNPKIKKFSFSKALKKCFSHPQTWYLYLSTGLLMASVIALTGIFGVTLLEEENGMTRLEMTQIIMAFFVAFAISIPTIGFYSTKQKKRKPYVQVGSFLLLIIATSIIFMGEKSFTYYFTAYLLLGIATGIVCLTFTMIHERNVPKIAGTTIGLLVSGVAFFSMIEFHLIESIKHSYVMTSSLVVIPISILIACILSFFLLETQAKQRLVETYRVRKKTR